MGTTKHICCQHASVPIGILKMGPTQGLIELGRIFEHLFHTDDPVRAHAQGCAPRRQVLVERDGILKHGLQKGRTAHVPIGNIGIEIGSAIEHVIEELDVAGIPRIQTDAFKQCGALLCCVGGYCLIFI